MKLESRGQGSSEVDRSPVAQSDDRSSIKVFSLKDGESIDCIYLLHAAVCGIMSVQLGKTISISTYDLHTNYQHTFQSRLSSQRESYAKAELLEQEHHDCE